jgi:hypothetical protein
MPMAQAYPFFDPHGYRDRRDARLVSRVGGPRKRVFGRLAPNFAPELTKYPLFRQRPGDVTVNPHYLWPRATTLEDRPLLGLLHYKFDGLAMSRTREALARGGYWLAGAEYRVYAKALESEPALSFRHEGSRRFRLASDLAEAGLVDAHPALAGSVSLGERARAAYLRRRAETIGIPIGCLAR